MADKVLPKLEIMHKISELALHIPCSAKSMKEDELLTKLAYACSNHVYPSNIDCCGFAGDKGFTLPELNKNALRNLNKSFPSSCQHGVSMSKTCQIGLANQAGFNYDSIEALLDQCSE